MTSAASMAREASLLRRGFALEYVTLCWNIAEIVVLTVYPLMQSAAVLAAGITRGIPSRG